MRRDCPQSARWPTSGPSLTNSVNILPQRATSTTCASSCAKPPRPFRRTSKNLRFLMTANTQSVPTRRSGQVAGKRPLHCMGFHLEAGTDRASPRGRPRLSHCLPCGRHDTFRYRLRRRQRHCQKARRCRLLCTQRRNAHGRGRYRLGSRRYRATEISGSQARLKRSASG
jgi:hypothetical protein